MTTQHLGQWDIGQHLRVDGLRGVFILLDIRTDSEGHPLHLHCWGPIDILARRRGLRGLEADQRKAAKHRVFFPDRCRIVKTKGAA